MITPTNTISFTTIRSNDGKVDIEGSLIAARKAIEEFAASDDTLTVQIGEAAIKVWNEPRYSRLHHISTPALGRMALVALNLIPDDKACKDAAKRVAAVLSGQPDKFLVIKSGPNKGIHCRSRLSQGEIMLLTTSTKK